MTDIQKLFQQWLAARRFGYSRATEEECDRKLAEYRRLQEAIIAAEPREPRDVAIMLFVDTDAGDSDMSGAFTARLCQMAGLEAWGQQGREA